MSDAQESSDADPATDFEREASKDELGLVSEFCLFLRQNKKWWLIPLVGSLFLIGLISLLTASGAAPFVYTLF